MARGVLYMPYEDKRNEEKIKDISRKRKEALINQANRAWLDLSEDLEV
jgi:predicted GIY-YIG superfamily endonuclease